ncbi:MAG: hypothetical protein QM680_10095 [Luteolibacter sp.]
MHWTEPAIADDSHADLEKKLWNAANQHWSNAAIKTCEYSPTVLGLISLRYADVESTTVKEEIQPQAGSRWKSGPTNYLLIQYFHSALNKKAAPGSSWKTLPPMPAPPSRRFAKKSFALVRRTQLSFVALRTREHFCRQVFLIYSINRKGMLS